MRIQLASSIITGLLVTVVASSAFYGNIGPDVAYTDCTSIAHYGPIGGIHAYSLDSYTCNVGDENLLWGFSHNGTPALAMNAYRLYDGRLEQIGMSWVKHSCCAAAGSGCGLPCNNQGGSVLGVGCRDIYSSGYNAIQSNLGPRSEIDAYTGVMLPATGGSGDEIYKRLQVDEAEMSSDNYPDALYFIEGVYVATDDAQAGNALNNASYRRVSVANDYDLTPIDTMVAELPAVYAWREYGNGFGMPDKSVQISTAQASGEGTFFAGSKAIDNGDGTWRYEYAVFNVNSERAAGAVKVPLGPGVATSNVGFHDVDYHSGEVYDNTDWGSTTAPSDITWQSPQTFAQNPDSNALRWGTMYNYWFLSDAPPAEGQITVQMFEPGTLDTITFAGVIPVDPCPADSDGDGSVQATDLLDLLAAWGTPNPALDIAPDSGNGNVDILDLLALLAAWGPCP